MLCLEQIETVKESNIFSPEIAKAWSQTPQWLPWAEEIALVEPVMTVMEANESDEYLKTVFAPQLLKFFNISNQIHSMYQLMQLQYTSYLAWTSCKNMAA